MKAVAAACETLTKEQIAQLEQGQLSLEVEATPIVIEREDVEIISEDMPGWTVTNEGALTVALDLTITDELRKEGLARELVKRIQNFRKDSGFEITDRISITVQPNEQLTPAIEDYRKYICTQVLADTLEIADNTGAEFDFEDFKVNITIIKK